MAAVGGGGLGGFAGAFMNSYSRIMELKRERDIQQQEIKARTNLYGIQLQQLQMQTEKERRQQEAMGQIGGMMRGSPAVTDEDGTVHPEVAPKTLTQMLAEPQGQALITQATGASGFGEVIKAQQTATYNQMIQNALTGGAMPGAAPPAGTQPNTLQNTPPSMPMGAPSVNGGATVPSAVPASANLPAGGGLPQFSRPAPMQTPPALPAQAPAASPFSMTGITMSENGPQLTFARNEVKRYAPESPGSNYMRGYDAMGQPTGARILMTDAEKPFANQAIPDTALKEYVDAQGRTPTPGMTHAQAVAAGFKMPGAMDAPITDHATLSAYRDAQGNIPPPGITQRQLSGGDYHALTPNQATNEQSVQTATATVKDLRSMADEIFTEKGMAARAKAAGAAEYQKFAQTNPKVQEYEGYKRGMMMAVVDALYPNAVRTTPEMLGRADDLFPKVFPILDTPEVASSKLDRIEKLLGSAKGQTGKATPKVHAVSVTPE